MGDPGPIRVQMTGRMVPTLGALLGAVFFHAPALAQGNPFGTGGFVGGAPQPAGGIAAWFLQQQAAFHKALSQAIGLVATEPSALWSLVGLAFLYGLVHAIGPGHGKAVIASYLVANETALKRGIALSFGAAGVQALIALGVVLAVSLVAGGGARMMDGTIRIIEITGFAIILFMGLWIMWRKGRRFFGHAGTHDPACDDPSCGHDHGDPAHFAQASTRDLALIAIGAGIRPCSGAVILLVFALAKGLFAAGALAVSAMALGTAIGTSLFALLAVKAKVLALNLISGPGTLSRVVLAVEMLAGLALALFGAALLTGMMSAGA